MKPLNRRRPVELGLKTLNPSLTRIENFRKGIRPQEGELEILPVLIIEGAVKADGAVGRLRFPAKLIIIEIVGDIRSQGRAAVNAARAEAWE